MRRRKKVLVLGGTGAIGANLVECLKDEDFDVYVTSRNLHESKENIHYILGNALDEEFLNSIISEGWDVIVDFMSYSTQQFSARVEVLTSHCAQYIFLSSCRVYSDNGGTLNEIIEDAPRLLDVSKDMDFVVSDQYAIAKAKQENELFKKKDCNWTIVRPYLTYGVNRIQLANYEKEIWLRRAMNHASIPMYSAMLERRTQLTSGKRVAEMLKLLIGNNAALGEVFNLVGEEYNITWKEIINLYNEVMEEFGLQIVIKKVSLEKICLTSSNPYSIIYDRLYDRSFSCAKFRTIAGESFSSSNSFESIKECLSQTIKNYSEKGHVSIQRMAYIDKICGERHNWEPGIKSNMHYFFFRYSPLHEFRNKNSRTIVGEMVKEK